MSGKKGPRDCPHCGKRMPFRARFACSPPCRVMTRVAGMDPSTCWEWPGNRNELGYGDVNDNDRHARAHRLAWVATHGPIPDGLLVLHRCDNPPCVNPAHLMLGTHQDNIADKIAKGRARGRLSRTTVNGAPRTVAP